MANRSGWPLGAQLPALRHIPRMRELRSTPTSATCTVERPSLPVATGQVRCSKCLSSPDGMKRVRAAYRCLSPRDAC